MFTVNNESDSPTPPIDESATVASPGSGAPLLSDSDAALTIWLPPVLRRSKRFDVVRLLGRGGFGDVYLAHDRHLSRLVALKVARTDRFTAPEQVDDFVREARAA